MTGGLVLFKLLSFVSKAGYFFYLFLFTLWPTLPLVRYSNELFLINAAFVDAVVDEIINLLIWLLPFGHFVHCRQLFDTLIKFTITACPNR